MQRHPIHPFSVISLAGGQHLAGVQPRARPERPPAEHGVVGPAQGGQGGVREEWRRRPKGHTISNVACAQAALRSAVAAGACWRSGVLVSTLCTVHRPCMYVFTVIACTYCRHCFTVIACTYCRHCFGLVGALDLGLSSVHACAHAHACALLHAHGCTRHGLHCVHLGAWNALVICLACCGRQLRYSKRMRAFYH